MKALTKEQRKDWEGRLETLNEKFTALADAVAAYNEAVAKAWDGIAAAQTEYNAAVENAVEFRDQVVSDIDDYVDEKSDKWKEGEKADNYQTWKDAWEGAEIPESELEQPDDLEMEVEDAGESLSQLPTEVE